MTHVPITHPWIDAGHAPIYEIRFPESPSDEELASFCACREEWARQANYRVSWVVDLSRLNTASAVQRRTFGAHLDRFEAHDVAFNQGSALVVPNAFLRGLVTAVFWIKPPKFPHRAFETVEDARLWARSRLENASR